MGASSSSTKPSCVTWARKRQLARAPSSTLNDLAFILKRAITEGKPVVLQRGEARTLQRLLDEMPHARMS